MICTAFFKSEMLACDRLHVEYKATADTKPEYRLAISCAINPSNEAPMNTGF